MPKQAFEDWLHELDEIVMNDSVGKYIASDIKRKEQLRRLWEKDCPVGVMAQEFIAAGPPPKE